MLAIVAPLALMGWIIVWRLERKVRKYQRQAQLWRQLYDERCTSGYSLDPISAAEGREA